MLIYFTLINCRIEIFFFGTFGVSQSEFQGAFRILSSLPLLLDFGSLSLLFLYGLLPFLLLLQQLSLPLLVLLLKFLQQLGLLLCQTFSPLVLPALQSLKIFCRQLRAIAQLEFEAVLPLERYRRRRRGSVFLSGIIQRHLRASDTAVRPDLRYRILLLLSLLMLFT